MSVSFCFVGLTELMNMSVPLILSMCVLVLLFQSWLKRTYSSQCWSAWHCRFLTGRWIIPQALRKRLSLDCPVKMRQRAWNPHPGVARYMGSAAMHPAPSEEPHPTAEADEILVKKKMRALKWVKQQVSALLHGEDLPEGTQARKVALRSPTKSQLYQGKARTVLCVSSPLKPTTT